MVDEELTSLLQRIYTAIQRGDVDELQRNLAHDIEWVNPESVPWGGAHHGHLGVAAMREVFEEHVDGIWADPDEVIQAGETTVVLGRMSGRARRSDREFEVEFAHVWRLREGVPATVRTYYDASVVLDALDG